MLSWQPKRGNGRGNMSYAELKDWREQTRIFSGIGAWSNSNMNISDDRGLPEQARGAYLTANTFSVLGQRPLLGRDFGPERRASRHGSGRHRRVSHLEEPLRGRSQRRRQAHARQWPAGGDCRRHARRHAVPAEQRYLGGVRPHRAAGTPDVAGPERVRPRAGRHRPHGSADGDEHDRRAADRSVRAGLPGAERRQPRDVQPAVQRRAHSRRLPLDDGRGRVRAAHRVRQRREPAALALRRAGARSRRAHRDGGDALAGRAPAAHRERPAGGHRRRARAR